MIKLMIETLLYMDTWVVAASMIIFMLLGVSLYIDRAVRDFEKSEDATDCKRIVPTDPMPDSLVHHHPHSSPEPRHKDTSAASMQFSEPSPLGHLRGLSELPAKLLFDAMDPNLGVVEVNHAWTRLVGTAGRTLCGCLGKRLFLDSKIWMRPLLENAFSGDWTAENAQHTYPRKVMRTYPDGSKRASVIVLTLLAPPQHFNVEDAKYVVMLSAETFGPLYPGRHCRSSPSSRGSHASRGRRPSRPLKLLPPVVEDDAYDST